MPDMSNSFQYATRGLERPGLAKPIDTVASGHAPTVPALNHPVSHVRHSRRHCSACWVREGTLSESSSRARRRRSAPPERGHSIRMSRLVCARRLLPTHDALRDPKPLVPVDDRGETFKRKMA